MSAKKVLKKTTNEKNELNVTFFYANLPYMHWPLSQCSTDVCKFSFGVSNYLPKPGSALACIIYFSSICLETLLFEFKNHFVPFGVWLANFIPYLLVQTANCEMQN